MPTLDILKALNENEFQLLYQPQVDQERKIIAVEALIRWNHVKYGLMTPNTFLPTIKEIATLNEVNKWVTETACNTLNRWATIDELNDVVISINISPFRTIKNDFLVDIHEIIQQTKINPLKLKVEITEQNSIADLQSTMEAMKKLQSIGVQFSLDDFGTGYSSFKHLQELPIQEIKIDRCFVDGLTKNNRNLSIVKSIIKIGQDLQLKIVAEGVETIEQMDILLKLGCRYFQGYYFHKPKSQNEIESFYSQKNIAKLNTLRSLEEINSDECLKYSIDFWKQSSVSLIYSEIQKLLKIEDLDFFFLLLNASSITKEYFIYYCWFFSDGPLLDNFINRKDVPIPLLTEIIFAGLSINESSMNPVDYFSFWSEKLSADQSLRLLSNTKDYRSHPILIACLLSNLDAKAWEEFFTTLVSEEAEIYKFLKLFQDFSVLEREKLFSSNQTLCKYFNLLITLISGSEEDPFLIDLKESIDKTLKWEGYAMDMKASFLIENEIDLPPSLRNSNRISCIIHDVKNLPLEEKSIFLTYLYKHSVIIDKQELLLIEKVFEMQDSMQEEFLLSG